MSMQSGSRDRKGRSWDQVTKDGSSSAGTYGSGGTGDVDRDLTGTQSGNQQRGRTDDLLSAGSDTEARQGFTPGEQAGELKTGMGGMGSLSTGNAGNRQSAGKQDKGSS